GIEHEIRAEHGRDRAAGAEGWYLGVGRCAEEQSRSSLHHRRDEPTTEVEEQYPSRPNASSTFLPKMARNNMFPRMWSQPECMNITVIQPSPHGRPPM